MGVFKTYLERMESQFQHIGYSKMIDKALAVVVNKLASHDENIPGSMEILEFCEKAAENSHLSTKNYIESCVGTYHTKFNLHTAVGTQIESLTNRAVFAVIALANAIKEKESCNTK